MTTRRTAVRTIAVALAATAIPFAAPAFAQAWPSKPITYVVPFPPGGTTDVLARIIAQKLGPALGTTIVIENKPGAGGNVGSEFVAKAAPDGYTIMGGTISSHSINVSLYPKLPHDPVKSFAPITLIGSNPNILVVNAASPFRSLQDITAALKAKPGSLSYASAGNGTSQHLSAELYKFMAGVDMVHIPYKGSGPAIQDVMGGQVPMMFDTSVVAGPHIESGRLRALAVTSAKRSAAFPNVPTVAEQGVPGYDVVSWQGGVRAGRHAAADHRPPLHRDREDPEGTRGAGALRQARPRPVRHVAGRLRRVPEGRDREVGQGHQGREHPHRLIDEGITP